MNEYLRVFRALTDENRIKILKKLSEGEQCACCLLEGLKISQPTLSHHMKILCESGLVRSERIGVWMYYSVDSEGCRYAGKLIESVIKGDMKRWMGFFRAAAVIIKPFAKIRPRMVFGGLHVGHGNIG